MRVVASVRRTETLMAVTLKFAPGSTIRWGAKRFVVVDYADMDSIVARELGKRRLERIPVQETALDRSLGDRAAWTPDLVSIPQKAWQTAVKRFKALKPLIEMPPAERTLEKVQKVARMVKILARCGASWTLRSMRGQLS